jgi:hypothetical protein
VSGAYCPNCGAPASTAAAGPAAPLPPPRRRTSPIVWILVGLLGLFIIGAIIIFAGGVLLVHKANQAGVDVDLLRTNPGLAISKLIVAANPDAEVVRTDDGAGTITVRDKRTGKVITMTFDDARKGNFKFEAEGEDGKRASLEFNGATDKIPAEVPVYPGAKVEGTFSVTGDGGGGQGSAFQYTFTTSDPPRKVMSFYHNKLEDAGMKLALTTNTADGGMVVAEDDARGQTINVIVEAGPANNTSIRVTMRVKKQ